MLAVIIYAMLVTVLYIVTEREMDGMGWIWAVLAVLATPLTATIVYILVTRVFKVMEYESIFQQPQ